MAMVYINFHIFERKEFEYSLITRYLVRIALCVRKDLKAHKLMHIPLYK